MKEITTTEKSVTKRRIWKDWKPGVQILTSPAEAIELISAYFKSHAEKPSISGLAYALGFASNKSLADYIERDDELSAVLQRAILYIENVREEHLYQPACTGSIFWWKQRGWNDSEGRNPPAVQVNVVYYHEHNGNSVESAPQLRTP